MNETTTITTNTTTTTSTSTNNDNENNITTSTPPPPPPLPPLSINKTNTKTKTTEIEFFKIIIPDNLKGTEIEKEIIANCLFSPNKPVVYVPFNFIIKNQKLKASKAIISSKWLLEDTAVDNNNNTITDISKQLQYSDTNVTFTPQKEHANKTLKIEIKLLSSTFKKDEKKSNSNIFSKLFSNSVTNSSDIDTNQPIIIEYTHKILFEKSRDILKISEPNSVDNRYKVISYNILADCYVSESWYTNIPSYALRWSTYRSKLLIKQILQYDADIIGTQEVDRMYWELFKEMGSSGYVYYPHYEDQDKPATTMSGFDSRYREGSFIFFKKDRFSLIKGVELDYTKLMHSKGSVNQLVDKELLDHLIQDPIYKICISHYLEHSSHHVHHCLVLIEDKKTKQKMIVCSKHMYWGSSQVNYQVQGVQIHLFTLIVSKFIKVNNLEKDIPIIICGDFNSSPGGSVYNYLTQGVMMNDDHHLTLAGKYEPAFQSSYFDNHKEIKSIKHNFNFMSTYSKRPDGEPKTTIVSKAFSGCIDFIFASKDRFKVNSVLEIGEKKDYKELPSLVLASDHILLMSDLELLPSSSTSP